MIGDNKVTISHDPLPDVMADSTQLIQLFQNLIFNGIKFQSDEAPQIHVSAEKKESENGYFQCRITELGLIRNIRKKYLKYLKDCIPEKNILEQE